MRRSPSRLLDSNYTISKCQRGSLTLIQKRGKKVAIKKRQRLSKTRREKLHTVTNFHSEKFSALPAIDLSAN